MGDLPDRIAQLRLARMAQSRIGLASGKVGNFAGSPGLEAGTEGVFGWVGGEAGLPLKISGS